MSKKFKEIAEVPAKELQLKLKENREQIMKLRIQKSGGQLEQTHQLGALRRQNARILTALKLKANNE